MSLTLLRLRIVIILCVLRGVVARFKPEIQLISLLFTAYIGSEYFASASEYSVCIWALCRKYKWILSTKMQ